MNIRVLNSFLCVCRTGSITKAAEILHISQPALSRQIIELESELDAKLFTREGKRMQLTESGCLMQTRAQEIVEIAARTKREIAESGAFLSGIVRIGCVESSAVDMLLKAFRRVQAHYPHVVLEAYSADGDDIRAALDLDKIDMGIVLEPIESAKYEALPLPHEDVWGIVVRRDSPEGALDSIDFARASEMPLILPRRYIVLDDIAAWFGVEPEKLNVVLYHNLPTLAFRFAAEGLGAVLCVKGSFDIRPVDNLKFLPFDPIRTAGHRLIRRRNRRLSKACEILWERASVQFAASQA